MNDELYKGYGPFPVPTEAREPGRLMRVLLMPARLLAFLMTACIMGGMTLAGFRTGRKA